ncbi:MAG: helix-turn-helix domain-containing protein, partial [Bacteroidetes bacterium]
MKNIFSTLKEARLRKGLKLREVAAQTGIDAALLSKMEQGR